MVVHNNQADRACVHGKRRSLRRRNTVTTRPARTVHDWPTRLGAAVYPAVPVSQGYMLMKHAHTVIRMAPVYNLHTLPYCVSSNSAAVHRGWSVLHASTHRCSVGDDPTLYGCAHATRVFAIVPQADDDWLPTDRTTARNISVITAVNICSVM
jgi:hypothetical protein